jgi:hypothetical protein
MRFVLELKVKSIVLVFNAQAFLSSIMLNDELLEEEESPLVIHSLSDLNLSNPQVRCVGLLTIWALLICNNEFYDKALLKKSSIKDFLLNSELHLDTF